MIGSCGLGGNSPRSMPSSASNTRTRADSSTAAASAPPALMTGTSARLPESSTYAASRPLQRRFGVGQAGQQGLGHLDKLFARTVEALGCDGAAALSIPRLEESVEHVVNETTTHARTERRLVLGRFIEIENVRRKEFER